MFRSKFHPFFLFDRIESLYFFFTYFIYLMTRNSSIVNIDSRNIGELLQYLGNNDIKYYEIYKNIKI